ncbi:MAG: OmpA family protein [Phaeodactylibacter sp.]|nr:OmpA family protein [Phaeodactylibacter sp.]MCB9275301.1 OmpA family protein [Lewinellaceae bacterium]
MKHFGLFLIAALALFSSCVTRKEYQELEEVRDYYQSEAQASDSIRNEYNKLAEDNRQLEIDTRNTRLELEQYVVTNQSLYRSYREALDRIESLAKERNELDATASYEKYSLEHQLSDQQQNLDVNKQKLDAMEYELYQKDSRLNAMEYDYTSMKGTLQDKNIRIHDLEQMLSLRENNMKDVRDRLTAILRNFTSDDLSVEERGGKLYLSLSSSLLFPSGSTRIDPKGKDALRQVAEALKANPDIDILVEGHTDSDGSADANWNLSVSRAVAVTNLLSSFGVNPEKITAAGRGEYQPKADNSTSAGKAKNRRTEIILAPKLDELYEFLSGE